MKSVSVIPSISISALLCTAALCASSARAAQWCERRSFVTTFDDKIGTAGKAPSCSAPAANLVDGRVVNGSTERTRLDLLPPWIDMELAHKGQKWARDHAMFLAGSHIFGLSFVLTFPDNNAVLLFTNMSETAEKAKKRYIGTIQQVATWYTNDLKEGTENNSLLDSMLRVRAFHEAAMIAGNERLHGEKQPLINPDLYSHVQLDEEMWAALKSDLENSDLPQRIRRVPSSYQGRNGEYFSVSQWQQALTQFAFVGFPILYPERLMIMNAKDEDLHAFNHLWAVLGYMLGIDDQFNVALQPDLESTRAYYKHIFEDWYIPQLFHLDRHSKILLEAQLKGFQLIRDGMMTPRTLMMRMMRDIVRIPVPELTRILTREDRRAMLRFYSEGARGYLQNLANGRSPGSLPPLAVEDGNDENENTVRGPRGPQSRDGLASGAGPLSFLSNLARGPGGGTGAGNGGGGPLSMLSNLFRGPGGGGGGPGPFGSGSGPGPFGERSQTQTQLAGRN